MKEQVQRMLVKLVKVQCVQLFDLLIRCTTKHIVTVHLSFVESTCASSSEGETEITRPARSWKTLQEMWY